MREKNILEHFGVKGMRWGVRKDGSNSSGRSKKPSSKEIKEARSRLIGEVSKRERAYYEARTIAGKNKAEIELNNYLSGLKNNPDAAIARQRTRAEKGKRFLVTSAVLGMSASMIASVAK